LPSTSEAGTASPEVVFRRTSELVPYATNARTHSSEQVAQIAASIREFGFTNPILISPSNGIIAGHARWDAAKLLNLDEVPCIELGYLTPLQRRAYIIADNKLALNAGWDESLLRLELADLRDMAFDLSLIGFGVDEQAALLADRTEGLTDPDDAPEAPEHPVSRTGDLWLLGAKVTCPKCHKASPIERAIKR
jgi:ParB-like chromosome segregation protein Spo0J